MTTNLDKIDLNLLRLFCVLMEERNVSAAARRLKLTQSTVSNALVRLRQQLGDRLLERSGNAMVPTRLALDLWPGVRAAMEQIEGNLQRLERFDPGAIGGVISIGIDEYSHAVFGAQLATLTVAAAPKAALEFLPLPPMNAGAALENGELDLCIGPVWRRLPRLSVEPLFHESFVCLVRRRGASPRMRLGLDEYLARPHVLISPSGRIRGNVDFALAPIGLTRRVAVTTPYFLSALGMVGTSDWILHLGRRLAYRMARHWPVVIREPPVQISGFDVCAVAHPRDAGSPRHRWLMQLVRSAIAETVERSSGPPLRARGGKRRAK